MTAQERAVLDFESTWWRYAGNKEAAISDRFGLTPTRYYQVLNRVLSTPEAVAENPLLVSRLRRVRASRKGARAARRAEPG
jgi:hypothetical protein